MSQRWERTSLSRRRFLGTALSAAAFAGIAVTVTACDDDDGGAGPNNDCIDPVEGQVSSDAGHTHSVREICPSEAGTDIVLTLSGSGHTHTATLAAAQLDQIFAGQPVSVASTSDNGHAHTVSFN